MCGISRLCPLSHSMCHFLSAKRDLVVQAQSQNFHEYSQWDVNRRTFEMILSRTHCQNIQVWHFWVFQGDVRGGGASLHRSFRKYIRIHCCPGCQEEYLSHSYEIVNVSDVQIASPSRSVALVPVLRCQLGCCLLGCLFFELSRVSGDGLPL